MLNRRLVPLVLSLLTLALLVWSSGLEPVQIPEKALAASPHGDESVDKKLSDARHLLTELHYELPEMACCTNVPCVFCPMAAGKCPCMKNLAAQAGVCGECYLGWQAGEGRLPSLDPKEVKMMEGQLLLQMYQMRAQHFGSHDHSKHQH